MEKTDLCTSKAGSVRTEEEQSSHMPERQEASACKHSRDNARQYWGELVRGATYKHTLSILERTTEKKQGGLLCEHCWDTYIQEPPIAEDTEQRVHVALTGEVKSCPNVATW